MANTASVLIKFLGDAKGAERAAKEASGAVGKVGKVTSKLTGPAVAAAGAVAGIAIAAGKAASDAQQSMGSVESVFGKFAGSVVSSSEKAASSVGLSANAYREMAAKIGGQLKNAGIPMDQLAARTDALIRQGSDLAATFGGSTADAVDALGASLRGEADPAERYALALSQTNVNALLAARGQSKLTGQALATAKAQATMDLITKQSADSTGQFAREADTASGQQQRMAASTADAAAALGQALLPAMTKVAEIIATVTGWMQKNTAATWIIIGVIAALAAGILILNGAMTIYTAVVTFAGEATAAAWLAALWPIALVIVAVIAIIAIVVLLWNKCAAFRTAVTAIWNGIRVVIGAVASFVMAAWARVWPAISAGIRFVVALFRVQFMIVSTTVRLVAALLGAVFRVAFGVLRAVASPVFSAITAGFNAVKGPINSVANLLKGPLTSAFNGIKSIAGTVGGAISSGLSGALGMINSVIGAVESLIGWLGKIKVPSIHIPGIGGKSAAATYAGTTAPRVGTTATATASSGSTSAGPVFVIQAVDPESAARTINRIQRRHTQRMGLTGTIRTA